MQTVYDLIRAEAAMTIECRNCGHCGKISALILRDRLGIYGRLDSANWRCTRCDERNVRTSIGGASLAKPPPRNYRSIM